MFHICVHSYTFTWGSSHKDLFPGMAIVPVSGTCQEKSKWNTFQSLTSVPGAHGRPEKGHSCPTTVPCTAHQEDKQKEPQHGC
mmetsp:Transcript_153929/g.269304  ORF Transcript_153929/g.269304 Transcript_153929/m.269304 type:complete len:83 (-) Transcript_153929:292-540(-)